ncbi:MAG: bacteriohemerythrin, partial [Alphaproteobacteria bacterium]|nr:bacteriohemerythrin [Alphaproteobacteria bacterium]
GAADFVALPTPPAVLRARVARLIERARLENGFERERERADREADIRRQGEEAMVRALEGKAVLNALLSTSLTSRNLAEHLQVLLDVVDMVPWLALRPAACLFLRTSSGDYSLGSRLGVSDDEVALLRRGLSAIEEAVLAGDSEVAAGRYVLPLLAEDRLLGVLLLFPPADHEPEPAEVQFVQELAETLSEVVAKVILETALDLKRLEIQETRMEMLTRLGETAERRDPGTGMHVQRVAQYCTLIGRVIGLSAEDRDLLRTAATLHDIGKLVIPDAVLLKNGRLTPEEFDIIKGHAAVGAEMLQGDDPLVEQARIIAGTHHEKWDGTGYPAGMAGEAIPLWGRICAIADVFDALTTERPYKAAWTVEKAAALIGEQAGQHFDPTLVAAFQTALPEIVRIKTVLDDNLIDPRERILATDENVPGWTDDCSVGIDRIDEHHKYLFRLVDDLLCAMERDDGRREVFRAVAALESYAQFHFAAEEQMMRAWGYPELEDHQAKHDLYRAWIRRFKADLRDNPLAVGSETAQFVRDWLVEHIKKSDREILSNLTKIQPSPDGAPPQAAIG